MTKTVVMGAACAVAFTLAGSAQAATFGAIADVSRVYAPVTVEASAADVAMPVILVGTTHIVCSEHKVKGTRPPRK
jgi:hypothetical protein